MTMDLKTLRETWGNNAANARLGAPHYSGLCVIEPAEVLALIDELEKARAELATAEAKRKGTVAAIPEIVNQSNATARAVAFEEAARTLEGQHQPNCYDVPLREGTLIDVACSRCANAKQIRALAPLPSGLRVMAVEDVEAVKAALLEAWAPNHAQIDRRGNHVHEWRPDSYAKVKALTVAALALLEAVK
jgi:hypothetical protein